MASLTTDIAKYLASHTAESAERMTKLLQHYKLGALAAPLRRKLQHVAAEAEQYEICTVMTAKKIGEDMVRQLLQHAGIPTDVAYKHVVDPDVLHGSVIYYKGVKYTDSAQGRINTFIQS